MSILGGCYCGAIRFEIDGQPQMRGLCLCRTCQKISGGGGNLFLGVLDTAFRYTNGSPKTFERADVADAPTREFCGTCGVHLAARSPKAPGGVIVKVGVLDEPAAFGSPEIVVWADEKQAFHLLPQGVPIHQRTPMR